MTLSIKPFKILFYFFFVCHDKSVKQMRSQRYWNTISSSSSSVVMIWTIFFLFLYLLIYLFRCCCCWRCWRWFRWLYINIIVTWIIAIIIVVDVRIYSSTFRTLCINRCNIPRRTLLLLLVLGGLGGFTYYNSYFDYPLKAPFVNNTKGTLIR